MSMYFYDETDDWPEYQIIKDDIRRLENEHSKVRKALKEAEFVAESNASNASLTAKVHRLKEKLKEIEKKLDGTLSLYR